MGYQSGETEIGDPERRNGVYVRLWFDVLNAAQADSSAFLASPGYS
jgi:hypothetical protein